jgi:hypothetical protein
MTRAGTRRRSPESRPSRRARGRSRVLRSYCPAGQEGCADPESKLARKGTGKEAKLSYSGHVLMENRNGLCVDFRVAPATGYAERDEALEMVRRLRRRGLHASDRRRRQGILHRRFPAASRRPGDPTTPRHPSQRTEGIAGPTFPRKRRVQDQQVVRKRVEEIFGWAKTVGGLRRTRLKGRTKTWHAGYYVMAAYNLTRRGIHWTMVSVERVIG